MVSQISYQTTNQMSIIQIDELMTHAVVSKKNSNFAVDYCIILDSTRVISYRE